MTASGLGELGSVKPSSVNLVKLVKFEMSLYSRTKGLLFDWPARVCDGFENHI